MGIATTTKTATTRQLSDQNSQGTVLGVSASDLIAFYGQAAVSQPTSSAQAAVTATSVAAAMSTPTGAVTVWGYSTAAIANGIVTLVNELRADLVNLGLIKGS